MRKTGTEQNGPLGPPTDPTEQRRIYFGAGADEADPAGLGGAME